ncbi:MAG: AMP-binding protein [Rhodospirillaceae bacterium]|nr:AMP-binding protein [Rhodospirillaceae bacterium]
MTGYIELPDYATALAEGVRLPAPEFYNFGFDLIDRRAAERDKTAFVYADANTGAEETWRFSDLSAASNRFANMLRGLGAAKGDFAFMMIPRIPAWYEAMIGCIKLGVVAMPGTNLLQPKDIEYRINKARARFAIITADHIAKIEAVRGACPTLEQVVVVGAPHRDWVHCEAACAAASDTLGRSEVEPTRLDETMLAYFTSGTTAFPKMVPRSHEYAIAHTLTARYWHDLHEDDLHWTMSDTGWAKAAWGKLFGQWQIGSAVMLYNPAPAFDADAHLRLFAEHGITTLCAPPTVFRAFMQIDLSDYDLSSLRHTVSAGEPLNPEALRAWKDATGTVPHDGYGQTETVNLVANVPGVPGFEVRPGSMGKPVPGMDVDIVDDGGNRLPDGEVGHIAVRTDGDTWPPGLFHGYYEDDAANAKCFRHGWYYTGDTATRDADGYIWFVGRADDLISSAGYRISPFEVESALIEHEAVAESAVVGKKDALRGEIVKAYVVLAGGFEAGEAMAKTLQDFVKATTAPYKYPREIAFVGELPKTISGKIRRVELRDRANAE